MGFAIRPTQVPDPAYPREAAPGLVDRTAPARWLARAAVVAAAAAAVGCPIGVGPAGAMVWEDTATWTEGEVLECAAAKDVVLAVAVQEGWTVTREVRTLWSLDVQHMGDAHVLTRGEDELLVATHDDDDLAASWAHGEPHACVVIPYEGACDTALCEDEPFGDVCAHFVRVPCRAGGEATYQGATHAILASLP